MKYLKQVFDVKLCKFILVGLLNTIAGLVIMFGLYNFAGFSYWMSSAVNYCLTSVMSFLLNWHFTFRYTGKLVPTVFRFTGNIFLCYVIAYGIAKPLIVCFVHHVSVSAQDNLAMFVGMCFFTGLNYFGQRFFVFRNRKTNVLK